MKLFRWLAVGCVAIAGLVLAFVAGVWYVKSAGEPTTGVTATTPTVPPTIAKAVAPTPQATTSLPPLAPEPHRPTIPEPGAWPEVYSSVPIAVVPAKAETPVPVTPVELAPKPVPIPPVADIPLPTPVTPLPGVTPISDPQPHPLDDAKPNYNFNTTAAQPGPKGPPVRYVDKPDLEFEYDIAKKGKSGVKAVSLFVRDPAVDVELPKELRESDPNILDGHWRSFGSTGNGQMLRYTMPKEGRYEFRLAVTSGNGNASAPKDSDPADMVVVLDTNPPVIEQFTATIKTSPGGTDGNVVDIRYKAVDANLSESGGTSFEYRPINDANWKSVKASKSGADGVTWPIPADAPAEVVLRVTVTDKAGNIATKVIESLNLDTTVPEGKLTKVRTVETVKKEEGEPKPPIRRQ